MMRVTLWRAVAVLAFAAAGVPRASHAAGPESDGQDLLDRGVELRRLGRDGEALEVFERANHLFPSPRGGAQVALAHQALGHWALAEQGLTQALRAEHDPWIALYRDALESALVTVVRHLGWVRVHSNVAKGEVVLNGESRYEVPTSSPIRVPSGMLEIEVRAPGYLPSRRTIEVSPGAEADATLDLEPLAPDPVAVSLEPLGMAPKGSPLQEVPRKTRSPADAYVAPPLPVSLRSQARLRGVCAKTTSPSTMTTAAVGSAL